MFTALRPSRPNLDWHSDPPGRAPGSSNLRDAFFLFSRFSAWRAAVMSCVCVNLGAAMRADRDACGTRRRAAPLNLYYAHLR